LSKTDTQSKTAEAFEVEVAAENDYLRRLNVTVAPSQVAATRRKEATKIRRSTRIKGFRKGKVPVTVVEERYGPLIDERTVTTLVNRGFRAAVEQHELAAIGEPVVSEVEYESGERLTFRVDIEVMPSIELSRTGGFRIERPKVTVNDTDVDEILESVRADHAVLEPVERAPETGDVVSVLILAAEEGADRKEKPYRFELGAGYAIPDVEAAILTLHLGEEGTFEVTYPDDFASDDLAGSTRSLRVRLDDVRAKRLPELTDDFARESGDFDSLDELRSAIDSDLRAHREREAEDVVREKLIDAVMEANAFEVPPSLVSRYLDRVIDAPEGTDPQRVDEARRSVTQAMERQVKRDLVLERLIEAQGLEPTTEEFDERLSEMGEAKGLSLMEVRRQLAKDKQLDALRHRLAVDKAFQFLIDRSEVR